MVVGFERWFSHSAIASYTLYLDCSLTCSMSEVQYSEEQSTERNQEPNHYAIIPLQQIPIVSNDIYYGLPNPLLRQNPS